MGSFSVWGRARTLNSSEAAILRSFFHSPFFSERSDRYLNSSSSWIVLSECCQSNARTHIELLALVEVDV